MSNSPAGRDPIRAIALLAVAGFASQSMVRVSDSLLPQIAADFGVSVGAASIVVTVYALAHGSVQLVAGPVADRFGKYLTVTIAAAVASLLVLLCGMAQSLPQLVMARLACGLSAGWIIPLAMAYVGDAIPYERRQSILARFLSGQILGQLFGQAAGGILGDFFGWRRVFFILAAIFAFATLALLYELLNNPATRINPRAGETSRGFAADYSAIIHTPWARIVILAVFLEAALLFGAFTYVGADLHLRFGLSFSAVGLVVASFAIGGLIYSLSVTFLLNRLGQIGLAIGGGLVCGLAFLTLALEPQWWLAPVASAGVGLGFYMLHNTLQVNATQMTPQARGTAVSIFSSALYLGQTVGVATAAFAVDRFTAVSVFLTSAAFLPVLGFWFAHRLREHRRSQPAT